MPVDRFLGVAHGVLLVLFCESIPENLVLELGPVSDVLHPLLMDAALLSLDVLIARRLHRDSLLVLFRLCFAPTAIPLLDLLDQKVLVVLPRAALVLLLQQGRFVLLLDGLVELPHDVLVGIIFLSSPLGHRRGGSRRLSDLGDGLLVALLLHLEHFTVLPHLQTFLLMPLSPHLVVVFTTLLALPHQLRHRVPLPVLFLQHLLLLLLEVRGCLLYEIKVLLFFLCLRAELLIRHHRRLRVALFVDLQQLHSPPLLFRALRRFVLLKLGLLLLKKPLVLDLLAHLVLLLGIDLLQQMLSNHVLVGTDDLPLANILHVLLPLRVLSHLGPRGKFVRITLLDLDGPRAVRRSRQPRGHNTLRELRAPCDGTCLQPRALAPFSSTPPHPALQAVEVVARNAAHPQERVDLFTDGRFAGAAML
mmetsp:Transcript_4372/g.11005  ORF Transcript_4372/g.11005 Transcript_4372/m.11005 type:complete len:419 (+) Transcript_4372:90-1346(+)